VDPARLPAPVRDRLVLVGYWTCSRDLRDRLGRWDRMDDPDRAATLNDLDLLAEALARLRPG
jgi:hypothetical protein